MKTQLIAGIFLISCFSIYSQSSEIAANIEKAKESDGKFYSSDGKLEVSINIAMIEEFYQWMSSRDTMICYFKPDHWDRESIIKALNDYLIYSNRDDQVFTSNFQRACARNKSYQAQSNQSKSLGKY